MILAAGLGTRLRPLTDLRAKPALPVRGRPVISLLLEFLARQGCREVMINLHHRPETIREAVDADHPDNIELFWSEESVPLGTGGGIRKTADFLAKDEGCVVMAGDMLLDLPLKQLFESHIASGRHATLLLRDDARVADFGSIGVNREGGVTRIGRRTLHRDISISPEGSDEETSQGLFTGVRFFSADVFKDWPRAEETSLRSPEASADPHEFAFEDLRDWLVPGIEKRGLEVGAEILKAESTVWEPVGTPTEYLRVNLYPPNLPTLGGEVGNWTGEVDVRGRNHDVILSRHARLPEDANLDQCVVWDGEEVPAHFEGHSGIYAGGHFVQCPDIQPGALQ